MLYHKYNSFSFPPINVLIIIKITPNTKFKHSIRLIIKLTYSKKLYPILNKFKYITIYDKPITVRPKPNKNIKNFIDKLDHLL